MKKPNMLIPGLDQKLPRLPMHLIVRECVQSLHVPEIIHHHQRVVTAALGGAPGGEAQHAVGVCAALDGFVAGDEVVDGWFDARGEEAEGVVEADAEVEDYYGVGGGGGAVMPGRGGGELGAGTAREDAVHVRIGDGVAGLRGCGEEGV